jgi:formylmethanofuran--tetrahydromethanopterin N-formyltransferase
MRASIDDTYAEGFDGLFTRVLLTAKDDRRLKKAAYNSTALPSVVIGRTEGGVERWLSEEETPDHRKGAMLQFWGMFNEADPAKSVARFDRELSYRIRQGILVVPTTALYNAHESTEQIDTMNRVGHCGDGYEWEEDLHGRRVIRIPLMMGDFVIERYLGYGRGVMGGNIWFMCDSEETALAAGDRGVAAILDVDGAITTFDICSAGSKPETNFPEIGPTTNHPYCPTLRGKIPDSMLPDGVNSIPEIVINGITMDTVKVAMRAAIESVSDMDGVLRITAGNYEGKLGKYKIYLRELCP